MKTKLSRVLAAVLSFALVFTMMGVFSPPVAAAADSGRELTKCFIQFDENGQMSGYRLNGDGFTYGDKFYRLDDLNENYKLFWGFHSSRTPLENTAYDTDGFYSAFSEDWALWSLAPEILLNNASDDYGKRFVSVAVVPRDQASTLSPVGPYDGVPQFIFELCDESRTEDAAYTLSMRSSGAPVASPEKYYAYYVFGADVTPDGVASNVAYMNDAYRAAIADCINSYAPLDSRASILSRAQAVLGKPYQAGACGPNAFDASGLVSYCVSGQYGARLGTAASFMQWQESSDPQPGDICTNGSNCGIYAGDGQMITVSNSRPVVSLASSAGMSFRTPPASSTVSLASITDDLNREYLAQAQKDAEYIANHINDGDVLAADSFGMKLTRAVVDAWNSTDTHKDDLTEVVPGGAPAEVPGPGYYVVVSEDIVNGQNTASSAPIFVLVGEGNTEISEKSAIPSVEKYVKEDSTGEWLDAADNTFNEDIDFRLVGSMPSNLQSYETYYYKFIDGLGAAGHFALNMDSFNVTIDGAVVDSSKYSIEENATGFSLVFEDILAAGVPVSASSEVVVEYSAKFLHLNKVPDYTLNTVCVEYSNNPMNLESHGTTTMKQVKIYSYALDIHKVDNASGEALPGVGFTIQNAAGRFIALNADGVVCEQAEAYTWTTDAAGNISVPGVDADTYTIAEVQTLEGYMPLQSAFTITIDASDRSAVQISASGSALVRALSDAIEVRNIKIIDLPTTGEAGTYIFSALGLGVLLVTMFYAVRRRRRSSEQ